MTITINKQTFILHPSGALFWEDQHMLLIADVHLGKVAHFRKHGVAVPQAAIATNFERLTSVVEHFKPQSLIFLGDLFHSSKNNEWPLFVEWADCCVAEIILVAGNHDIIATENYETIDVRVVEDVEIEGFLLTHHPEESETAFNFCGHIHPGIALRGIGRQALNLPCFFQKANQMILPAFGEFTGKYVLAPEGNDLVYACTKDEVVLVAKKLVDVRKP